MIDLSRVSNWIKITGIAFLGIVGALLASAWVSARNIPVLSSLASGTRTAWKAAAA